MIRIGKSNEITKVKYLPVEVVEQVQETLTVLDDAYGIERDMITDLGGYVAIIESTEDIQILKELRVDIYTEYAEWMDKIQCKNGELWIKALYMLSSDYAVVVVGKVGIIDMNKINE